MKETVLITGATSGIGLALAGIFAKEGYNLVLVSSCEKRLRKVAARLVQKNARCRVTTVCQDLSLQNAAENVYRQMKQQNFHIDILVNNAGFGLIGEVQTTDREKEEEMIRVNIQALTQLSRFFLQDMYRCRKGKILNVSSVGAFQPGPYTAAYYATKAYVSSFSRAMRYEAAKYNVQVCTLYPGTTRTKFFEKTGAKTPIYAMTPEKVALCAYEGLMKNKEMIVPGILNQILRWLPVKIKLWGVAFLKKQ